MSHAPLSRALDPRRSVVPALLAFLAGLVVFLVDATLNPRPGPVAYLLTPTPVALALYASRRPEADRRRLLALGLWGFLGTIAAGMATILVALGTRLPRPYAAWELFVLDLGAFLWFVLALAGAFVVAARTPGRRATVALVAGPVVQCTGIVALLVLTAADVVLFATASSFAA